MKYIKKNKIGVVVEHVDKELFVEAHGDASDWELVSDKECKRLCGLNQSIIDNDLKKQAVIQQTIRKRMATKNQELNQEFEQFQAWKASQGK